MQDVPGQLDGGARRFYLGVRVVVVPESPAPPPPPGSPDEEGKHYTTGEMARLSNNTLRTVRFYEEAGILSPLRRTEGGHRLFDRRELDRLMLVTDMRAAGMSLEQIRELLEIKEHALSGGDAAKKATHAMEGHLEGLRDKIGTLMRLYEDLAKTVEAASGCLGCQEERSPAPPAGSGSVPLFPDHCGECGKLTARGPLPRGMQILWAVSNGTGRREPAEEADGGDEPSATGGQS